VIFGILGLRAAHGNACRERRIVSVIVRDFYLDLLIKVLANMIYGDPSINPVNKGPFQAELREIGYDWPALAHTMVGLRRLENVRELTQRALDERIPGDFIETGVWRGGCCILMRGILAANEVHDRTVYVADSFAGLPPPNPQIYPADREMDLSVHEELAVPLETVKANFARYGLLDDQVVFVKGLFRDTLPALDAGPFCLLRLDGDYYESTYDALKNLYPKLSSGGFIIIDDFNYLAATRQAVVDYRSRMGITAPMHQVDWSASWWRKE
jgi:O-methyltransferase